MRKIFVALALLLGVLFLLARFAELNQVLAVLQRGSLLYLALALIVQLVWVYNLGAFYQSVYRVLGMEVPRWHMIKLVSAATFLTIVAPSAGLSAIAVYVADAQRNKRSPARVTVAAVLYVWSENIGTLSILVLGLGELARRNHLEWTEVTASLVLLAGGLGIGLLLYLGLKSSALLGKTLAWATRIINRAARPFIHHNYIQEDRAYTFSAELAEGLCAMRDNPRWITWPLLFTWTNKALLLIVMALCFMAFRVPLDVSTLVCGLSIAHLFLIVSPTPAGIGIVEGILAVALNGLGLPLGDATVVTLSYRFFSFWIPLLVGFAAFRSLGEVKPTEIPVTALLSTKKG